MSEEPQTPEETLETITAAGGAGSQTVELVAEQNQYPKLIDGEQMYTVRDADTCERLCDPLGTEAEARRELKATVEQIEIGLKAH